MIKKNINSLIVGLSVIKQIAYINTYLNLFPLMIGIIKFFSLKINRGVFFLILTFPLYGYLLIFNSFNPLETLFRNTQLMLLLFFLSYTINMYKFGKMTYVLKYIIILCPFAFVLELFFYYPNITYYREIFGLPFYRFAGIVGEPNFSGFLFFVLICISIYYKKKKYILLIFFFLFLVGSRASLLASIIFLIVYKFNLYNLSKYAFFLLFALPIILYLNSSMILNNYDIVESINYFTSGRTMIWFNYLQLILDNPYGFGAFQSQYLISDGSIIQAHNFFIQIISEYGVYSYLILFISVIFWIKNSNVYLFLFPLSINLYSINALTDVSLYLLLGLVFLINKKRERNSEKHISI